MNTSILLSPGFLFYEKNIYFSYYYLGSLLFGGKNIHFQLIQKEKGTGEVTNFCKLTVGRNLYEAEIE